MRWSAPLQCNALWTIREMSSNKTNAYRYHPTWTVNTLWDIRQLSALASLSQIVFGGDLKPFKLACTTCCIRFILQNVNIHSTSKIYNHACMHTCIVYQVRYHNRSARENKTEHKHHSGTAQHSMRRIYTWYTIMRKKAQGDILLGINKTTPEKTKVKKQDAQKMLMRTNEPNERIA